MSVLALDTSVAVPLLVATHEAHDLVRRWCAGRAVALSGHAAVETYSVLTRLPGDARLLPLDAATLMNERFDPPLALDAGTFNHVVDVLAAVGIAGGATYDALVALAAIDNDATLATRDARAKATYEAVGARTAVVG